MYIFMYQVSTTVSDQNFGAFNQSAVSSAREHTYNMIIVVCFQSPSQAHR